MYFVMLLMYDVLNSRMTEQRTSKYSAQQHQQQRHKLSNANRNIFVLFQIGGGNLKYKLAKIEIEDFCAHTQNSNYKHALNLLFNMLDIRMFHMLRSVINPFCGCKETIIMCLGSAHV